MSGVKMVHVPYKGGGPAAIALLSGVVGVLFAEPATIVQHIKSGKARALAVTTPKRSLGFSELIRRETAKWAKVVAAAGMKVD